MLISNLMPISMHTYLEYYSCKVEKTLYGFAHADREYYYHKI